MEIQLKKKEKLKAFIIRTVCALPVSSWALSRFSGGPSSEIKRQLVQDATPPPPQDSWDELQQPQRPRVQEER